MMCLCAVVSRAHETEGSKRPSFALYLVFAVAVAPQPMKEDGIRPTEKFYTALIRATGEGGRPDQTMALLEEMKRAGLNPGVRTFNAAVGACGKVGSPYHGD